MTPRTHQDPVQLLLPKGLKMRLLDVPKAHSQLVSLASLAEQGTVIFGHAPYWGSRAAKEDKLILQARDSSSQAETGLTSEAASSARGSVTTGVVTTTATTPMSSRTDDALACPHSAAAARKNAHRRVYLGIRYA